MSGEQFYINYSLNGEHYAMGPYHTRRFAMSHNDDISGNLALPMSISATSRRTISPTASWCRSRWLWGYDNQTAHKRTSVGSRSERQSSVYVRQNSPRWVAELFLSWL